MKKYTKEEIINAIDFVFSVWGDSKKKIKFDDKFQWNIREEILDQLKQDKQIENLFK